jgi:hypothetical protein
MIDILKFVAALIILELLKRLETFMKKYRIRITQIPQWYRYYPLKPEPYDTDYIYKKKGKSVWGITIQAKDNYTGRPYYFGLTGRVTLPDVYEKPFDNIQTGWGKIFINDDLKAFDKDYPDINTNDQ